jgi:hypothetical protein
MSAPIDGSSLSSSVGGDSVRKAARLKTCSIEGRRKESLAWGRGRIEVASAEAVLFAGRETRGRFSKSTKARLGDVFCVDGTREQQQQKRPKSSQRRRATRTERVTRRREQPEKQQQQRAAAPGNQGAKKKRVGDGVWREERATRGNG